MAELGDHPLLGERLQLQSAVLSEAVNRYHINIASMMLAGEARDSARYVPLFDPGAY
jgi:hypothetical protein